MKKLFLTIIAICLADISLMAQSPIHIKGKYKGDDIEIKGRKGESIDKIESIVYAPLQKHEKECKNLQEEKKKYEKRIKELQEINKKLDDENKKLIKNRDLKKLQDSLDAVTLRLSKKEQELNSIRSELNGLIAQLQQQLANEKSLSRSKDETIELKDKTIKSKDLILELKDDTIYNLRMRLQGKDVNKNVLSAETLWGMTRMRNNLTNQDFWAHKKSTMNQFQLAYTIYFSEYFPWALKTGIGWGMYNSNASFSSLYDTIGGLTDDDGDSYEGRYNYANVKEKNALKYIEIPLLIHVGNSFNSMGVRAWMEVGMKLGINVGCTFEGDGKYTSEGYYPSWNVTIHDVSALGFVSNADIYGNVCIPDVNKVVLWAVAGAGLHVPFGDRLGLRLGVGCAYSLTPVAKHDAVNNRYVQGVPNLLAGESTRIFSLAMNLGLSLRF